MRYQFIPEGEGRISAGIQLLLIVAMIVAVLGGLG